MQRFSRRVVLLAGLALVSAGGGVAWQWHAHQPLRQARRAYTEQKYLLSLRWSNFCLQRSPDNQQALALAARSLARIDEYDDALQRYRQVQQFEPEDFFLCGYCCAQKGQFVRAMELLEEAARMEPNRLETRRSLAVVYYQLERPQEGMAHAQHLLNDPQERSRGLALLGDLYFLLSRWDDSYCCFASLLEENPRLQGIPYRRRHVRCRQLDCLLQLGKTEEAALLLDDLGVVSNDLYALKLRGQLRYQQGDLDQAERDWWSALQLAPDQFWILTKLGMLLLERQRAGEALQWFEKALQLEPNNPVIHHHLALAHARLGHAQTAAQHREKARQLREPDRQNQALPTSSNKSGESP